MGVCSGEGLRPPPPGEEGELRGPAGCGPRSHIPSPTLCPAWPLRAGGWEGSSRQRVSLALLSSVPQKRL